MERAGLNEEACYLSIVCTQTQLVECLSTETCAHAGLCISQAEFNKSARLYQTPLYVQRQRNA